MAQKATRSVTPLEATLVNLLASLGNAPGFDESFESDINEALFLLTESPDPWEGTGD